MNPHLSKNQRFTKRRSLILIVVAYLFAMLAAVLSYPWVAHLGPLLSVLAMDVLATIVIWGIGIGLRNASVYDPYWSLAPPIIAVHWYLSGGMAWGIRESLMLLIVLLWAIRLTSNWVRDWPGLSHEDWRYQEMRANNGALYQLANLFGICLFPTILVFIGLLPTYFVLSGFACLPPNQSTMGLGGAFNWLDCVAALLGLLAVVVQFVSDEQMRAFRKSADGQTGFMRSGLWAWSRHPNYFGEVLFWFSLWLFALAAFGSAYAWTGVGCLAMLALFVFISCPWMDKRSADKRADYAEYMQDSSLLFPRFPSKT